LCGFCEDAVIPADELRCIPVWYAWAGEIKTAGKEPYTCKTGWKKPNATDAKVPILPSTINSQECMYQDATITVRYLSIALLPVLTILWALVTVVLYQERYQDKHKVRKV
jgi:hypothetical protein